MTSFALPPFLMTSEENSFARYTIEARKPLIVDRILSDFDYNRSIRSNLQDLKEEMASGQVQNLQETTSDRTIWDHDIQPWVGKSWLEIPWFIAETYFYRRVLEAVEYFQPGPWMGLNPYERLKTKEIAESLSIFTADFEKIPADNDLSGFSTMFYKALWGNRADLSNLHSFDPDMSIQSERVLRDDSESIFQRLHNQPGKIAYIFDNVGKELYFDLALIDYLLSSCLAMSVTCYLKNQPFFVSDAMPEDVFTVLNHLESSESQKNQALANRLTEAIRQGIVQIETPPFFTTSRMYRQLPEALKSQIASHDLAILKGDVNYRRLVGDRRWPYTTPLGQAAGYFPTSVVSLRTMKSELVVGLSQTQVEFLETEAESDWLINGKRGMISFLQK
jgi:hypothetical protein